MWARAGLPFTKRCHVTEVTSRFLRIPGLPTPAFGLRVLGIYFSAALHYLRVSSNLLATGAVRPPS